MRLYHGKSPKLGMWQNSDDTTSSHQVFTDLMQRHSIIFTVELQITSNQRSLHAVKSHSLIIIKFNLLGFSVAGIMQNVCSEQECACEICFKDDGGASLNGIL